MKKTQLIVAAVMIAGGAFLVRIGDLRGQTDPKTDPILTRLLKDPDLLKDPVKVKQFNERYEQLKSKPYEPTAQEIDEFMANPEHVDLTREDAIERLKEIRKHNIAQKTPTPTKSPVKTIPVKPPPPPDPGDGGDDGGGMGQMLSGLMNAMKGGQQQPQDPSQEEQQAMAAAQQTAEAAALAQQSPSAAPDVAQAAAPENVAEPAAMAAPAAAPSAAALAASNKKSGTSSKPDPEQIRRDKELFPKIELKM